MRWLDRLANHHRLFRRAVLVWACWLITWATWQAFTDPPQMGVSDAAALASVIGILTVVITFYFKHRANDSSAD
jgi:Co/Zn/Cd efflux system component